MHFLHIEKCRFLHKHVECDLKVLPQFWSKRVEILHTDSSYKCPSVSGATLSCLPVLRKIPISQTPDKISKIWLMAFFSINMKSLLQNFSPLASKLRGAVWDDNRADGPMHDMPKKLLRFWFFYVPSLACRMANRLWRTGSYGESTMANRHMAKRRIPIFW